MVVVNRSLTSVMTCAGSLFLLSANTMLPSVATHARTGVRVIGWRMRAVRPYSQRRGGVTPFGRKSDSASEAATDGGMTPMEGVCWMYLPASCRMWYGWRRVGRGMIEGVAARLPNVYGGDTR